MSYKLNDNHRLFVMGYELWVIQRTQTKPEGVFLLDAINH
jgi:hypothetical protein